MAKKYTPDADCVAAANAASGDRLTRDEIGEAFQRVADYRERLKAEGDITGMADKLRSFAEREAERTKIAAAMQKRHAALNVLVRDRLDQSVDSLMKQGLSPRQAMLAILEGTQSGVEGGRNSVAALNNAYEARYIGALFSELQRDRPHLIDALADPKLDADIMREMSELHENGKPGITGNQDAMYVAKVFATYAEMARTDLNKHGASIGKLDGWAGAQRHDDVKMIAAGKQAWIDAVRPKLDIERTFPDVVSESEITEALSGIYDTIITGFPNKATPGEKGQRVNPANLAKSLGKSRVLHFRDADAALAYRDQFGSGNTASGIYSHLRNAARTAANMDALGPNPEIMFTSIVETMKRRIKEDANIAPAEKQKQIRSLETEAGPLRQALDISTGLASRPVNVTAAKIGADIRAAQSMAKLGAALWSSLSDVPVTAIASMFRGSGFVDGLVKQLDGIFKGRPKGEQAEIAYLIGEGFDGKIGHIVSPAAANDSPVGKLAALQEKFFKWNGLAWWTDVNRATAGRVIAAEMGMRAKTAFADLPAVYRHVLGLHSIDAAKWDAIRQAQFRESNGNIYVTPDRLRLLDDAVIEPLVADRIAAAKKASKLMKSRGVDQIKERRADFEERRQSIIEDGRRDLELSVLRFIADETNYAVVEVDTRSRRTMTQGYRPGTFGGEALRYIGQFKGFPVAFGQRIVGRAMYGHRKDAKWIGAKGAHMGSLIAGMTVAGYMSIVIKDAIRGYWPPRDPTDTKTILAALAQGGAAGLYGDFLFGQVNRFGGGVLETIAGPTIGQAAQLVELGLKSRDAALGKVVGDEDAKFPAAEALSIGVNATPFANLYYVRPALDYLFLNSLRDAISPGYLKRQEKRRTTDYGQESFVQRTAF